MRAALCVDGGLGLGAAKLSVLLSFTRASEATRLLTQCWGLPGKGVEIPNNRFRLLVHGWDRVKDFKFVIPY